LRKTLKRGINIQSYINIFQAKTIYLINVALSKKKNNNKNNSRNMAILTKFLDFAMFGTRDLGHNGKKLRKNYHLH
jgi:hypothetical protein